MPTSFLQVADNAKAKALANSLNNTTSPLVISGLNTSALPAVTTGYVVTIWDDTLYPDPIDDPNMEKAVVTSATIATNGSLTLQRSAAKTHAGTPRIALLALAQHISDLDTAVNTVETTLATKANSASLATVATSGSYTDLSNKPSIPTQYTDAQASAAAPVQSVAGKTGTVTLTKSDVGLSNIDNTADVNKPVSTAQQAAITSAAASKVSKGDLLFNVKDYGALGDDATDDTSSLQAAINACPEGGVVYLPAGKYRTTSPLYIPRGVTLRGTNAPRWSYTYAPQSYIKIRSTFTGLAAIHLRDKEQGSYATEQGNIRIENLCIDGSAGPAGTTIGILATGLVKDVRIQNVTVRNMKGNGVASNVYTHTDTLNYYPRGWELSHVVADTCGNIGFSMNNLDDSILTDCLAVGNSVYGFYLAGIGEDHFTNCRAVFNKSHGFYVTGSSFGSAVFTGCTTDRNEFDGIRIDATGKVPIIFSGIGLRRDGRNGNSGGGSFAGMRITGATVPIVISGMITMTGQDDDATGSMSPQYGLRVGTSTSVQVNNAYIHGFTAAIQNDGSNTDLNLGASVTTATGSANAPTISTDHSWSISGGLTVSNPGTTAGSASTVDGTQTLTNKTISGASNTLTAIPESAITNLTTDLAATEKTVNKGVANGYAGLDGTGKIPSAQLPSYVDDVLDFANLAAFPATGSSGIIYVADDTNKTYRWSGSSYVEISASPGSTDSITEGTTNLYYTNARADARITAATGVSVQGFNANTTQLGNTATGTGAIVRATSPALVTPTGIVKADVGLSNVDNTSDAIKNAAVATLSNKDLTSGTNTFPTFNQNTTGTAAGLSAPIAESQVTNLTTDLAAKAPALNPTAVKTSAYTVVANDFVPVDTTTGTVTLTLPSAPANGTRFGAKLVLQGGTNTVTITRGGTDVFNKTGGSTSVTLTLLNQAVQFQYFNGIWYGIGSDIGLTALDARYAPISVSTGSTSKAFAIAMSVAL